ncbi:protein SIEVE ELEMENT OCCLUSION B [Sesamum angolense]|uniref:Protein SIEVE ELEMENT OCCLUSION B n=1 Tax=Sesamum angolense TaxID=2727404 RepID=A0AAE2BUI2_9LAMI|nr:protein SIEVE ELEMENT OCCLUSION B [Sesamum angolense]
MADAVIRTIEATHGMDNFEFDTEPLLLVIEDILSLSANDHRDIQGSADIRITSAVDVKLGNDSMQKRLVLKINAISWEILGNCSGGENMHETVRAIFNALSPFFWAGKGVIALAAFAVNYGEFWLVEQLRSSNNPVAQSLASLEPLPRNEQLTMFQDMSQLVKAILKLGKCICESFNLQSHKYFRPDEPVYNSMMAQIPEYTYWIIRSIVICQSNLNAYGYTTSSNIEASNLSMLVEKVNELFSAMRSQLDLCYQKAEKNRTAEVFQKLKRLTEMTSHKDNVIILKALISEDEDMPLYDGYTKSLVSIESLGKKTVLLYLSELKHTYKSPALSIFSEMYLATGKKPENYEILWVPMLERSSVTTPEKETLMFNDLRNKMKWLSFRDLSLLDPAIVEYIKVEWQFKRRSMIKVLDEKGRLVRNHDAAYMFFIWGTSAYPFTVTKETELWAEETWGVQLLLNYIVPSAIDWVKEGKHICLYGGANMEWIQAFTSTLLDVSRQAQIQLKMIYMDENVKTNDTTATSDVTLDPMQTMAFRGRLHSIWQSRAQSGMLPESDKIILDVLKMVGLHDSGRGWAIVSSGAKEMAIGMGDTALKALSEYDKWKGFVVSKGFVPALAEYMSSLGASKLCTTFAVPKTSRGLPTKMNCFECGGEMKVSTRFICYGD